MNLLLLVRAVGALSLPGLMVVGFLDRRRTRSAADRPEAEAGDASHLARLDRRALKEVGTAVHELRRYDLRRADLRGLPLSEVDLSGLDLRHARLRHAILRGTRLEGARLDYADLSSADLRGVEFDGVSLLETDLCGADLRGADLRSARQVEMANLRNVRSDRTTRWPAGFVPVSDAARHP